MAQGCLAKGVYTDVCNLLKSGILSNRSPNHPFVGCISISRLNRLLLVLPFDVARC